MTAYNQPPVRSKPYLRTKSPQLLLDHGRHIVWIIPPKNAQTSMRKWVGDVDVVSPATYDACISCIEDMNYRTIMTIRNPVDRICSAHRNKFSHVRLEKLITIAASHADSVLDLHLQSQEFLLRQIYVTTPDILLRVDQLEQDCARLPWMRGKPGHDNPSNSNSDVWGDIDLGLRMAFVDRFARDYELYRSAG